MSKRSFRRYQRDNRGRKRLPMILLTQWSNRKTETEREREEEKENEQKRKDE